MYAFEQISRNDIMVKKLWLIPFTHVYTFNPLVINWYVQRHSIMKRTMSTICRILKFSLTFFLSPQRLGDLCFTEILTFYVCMRSFCIYSVLIKRQLITFVGTLYHAFVISLVRFPDWPVGSVTILWLLSDVIAFLITFLLHCNTVVRPWLRS